LEDFSNGIESARPCGEDDGGDGAEYLAAGAVYSGAKQE
jgi:hypothetical protein